MLETALSGIVCTMSSKVLVRFSPLTPMMYYVIEVKALNFGFKRWFKVTVE